MITPPSPYVRCRYCGDVLRGFLPVDHKPNGAMLLHHLSQQHPDQVGPYLERMRTEDIGTVAMEAYERITPCERPPVPRS
jgi:hypothetical protein